ncbi:nucleotide sugar dehydrogenase [Sphingopyxis terrae]|uniref:nucleotide sugar dehydrogenase n=1 Tax=Sphingopyxis terrae TaxID=33052 RepID=UPI003F7FFB3B
MAAAPAPQNEKIVVLGLGYVGLPVAVALARAGFDVTGFDISSRRVASLAAGSDWTGEVADTDLQASGLRFSDDPTVLDGASFIIVTVPTPIDAMRRPDLGPIESACQLIGPRLAKGAVVVFESTVYPGVTEDMCGPLLAEQSGLRAGADFFLGYSPERINPGDKVRRLETITKIVAADTPQALDRVRAVYGAIIEAGLHEAPSIRVAEAAKVIENAQRDINIAFMNEVTRIFARDGISVWDVLDAAGTKWNFLPFTPGLVGGHCIGVDPYYLSHRAEMLGHDPQVILAGRSINDDMGRWIADRLHDELGRRDGKILVLGLTFKENVPDLRNSKVADVIARLKWLGHEIIVHDPHADGAEAVHEYAITLAPDALAGQYDAVLAAVPHREYGALSINALNALLREDGLLFDLKRLWPDLANGSAALAGDRRYRGL